MILSDASACLMFSCKLEVEEEERKRGGEREKEKKETNARRRRRHRTRLSPTLNPLLCSLGSDKNRTGLLESVCTNACLSVLTSGSASMAF